MIILLFNFCILGTFNQRVSLHLITSSKPIHHNANAHKHTHTHTHTGGNPRFLTDAFNNERDVHHEFQDEREEGSERERKLSSRILQIPLHILLLHMCAVLADNYIYNTTTHTTTSTILPHILLHLQYYHTYYYIYDTTTHTTTQVSSYLILQAHIYCIGSERQREGLPRGQRPARTMAAAWIRYKKVFECFFVLIFF
jgi:hypothetical protein